MHFNAINLQLFIHLSLVDSIYYHFSVSHSPIGAFKLNVSRGKLWK